MFSVCSHPGYRAGVPLTMDGVPLRPRIGYPPGMGYLPGLGQHSEDYVNVTGGMSLVFTQEDCLVLFYLGCNLKIFIGRNPSVNMFMGGFLHQ